MTIMNLANDGNHSILITIYRFLMEIAPERITIEQLRRKLVPQGYDAQDKFIKTIKTWVDLKLLDKENDTIGFSQSDIDQGLSNDIRSFVEKKLKTTETDFTIALRWLYAQNTFEISWAEVLKLVEEQFPGNVTRPFSGNGVEWPGFVAWGKFLEYIRADKENVYLDFSWAIKRFVEQNYKIGEVDDFILFFRKLQQYYPFLPPDSSRTLPMSISLEMLDGPVLKFINQHDFIQGKNKLMISNKEYTHIERVM